MTGLGIEPPEETCDDDRCPFHGQLSVRGQTIEGEVVSKDNSTIVVEREYAEQVPKYERYMKRRSRTSAHLSPCLDVEEGDTVKVGECRKLSKSKSFVALEVTGE